MPSCLCHACLSSTTMGKGSSLHGSGAASLGACPSWEAHLSLSVGWMDLCLLSLPPALPSWLILHFILINRPHLKVQTNPCVINTSMLTFLSQRPSQCGKGVTLYNYCHLLEDWDSHHTNPGSNEHPWSWQWEVFTTVSSSPASEASSDLVWGPMETREA